LVYQVALSPRSTWKMRRCREAAADELVRLGKEVPHLVCLNADVSSSSGTQKFEKEFPTRFFNAGVAEANMMAMSAGLATTGKTVVASTFAVFAIAQPYNVIRQSIAYPNMNVKIFASHAGVTVGGDGATHQMLEDVSMMRGLPNFRVIVPADELETKLALRHAVSDPGPFYIRVGRSEVPTINPDNYKFHLGQAAELMGGTDLTIIANGQLVVTALDAADLLRHEGIEARVLNMHTVKPIDKEAVERAAVETGGIVTAEEHSVYGGLGSAVAEVASETHPVRVARIGTQDVFGRSGEIAELLEHYGLTQKEILAGALQAARHDVQAKIKRSSTLMAVIEKAKPLRPMVESYAL
jgi:transketolase